MSAPFEPGSPQAARRETAAEWLQRLSDKQMSEEDAQAWLNWYGASEANRQAFDEIQAFRVQLHGVNAQQRATLSALLRENKDQRAYAEWTTSRRVWAAAACAAVLAGVAAWKFADLKPQVTAYAAPIDRYRAVPLADGSQMVLSARAVANVAFTRDLRSLEMVQGAAYFQVQRDPRRPFVVKAGEVSITAVGTAFSVKREADKLSVTVTEGSVDVLQQPLAMPSTRALHPQRDLYSAAPQPLRVKTGERTEIAVGRTPVASAAPPSSVGSPWQDGSMQFFNVPLGKVIEAVSAQAGRSIYIEDPRVTDLNYSGTVFRERIDEWVAALPLLYPVRSVTLADGTVTLVLRSGE